MARKEYIECEFCKTLTENVYKTKDWLQIHVTGTSELQIAKSVGVTDSNGKWKTVVLSTTNDWHFCSDFCFIEFFKLNKIFSNNTKSPEKPIQNGKETFII